LPLLHTVEHIPIAQFKTLVESDRFQSWIHIPISIHRAYSQMHNPFLQGDEIGLILILNDKDQLVAYLGLLPDEISIQNKKIKISWLSCIWVDPACRGQGLGKQLVSEALLLNTCLAATDFTMEAEKLYVQTQSFQSHFFQSGKRFYLRMPLAKILPKKNKKWKLWIPVLHCIDQFVNYLIDLRKKDDLDSKISSYRGPALEETISLKHEWIQNYPWILESQTQKEPRYYFSSFEPLFKQGWIQSAGWEYTYVFVIHRNETLKILYHCCVSEEDYLKAVQSILDYARKEKIDIIICYDDILNRNLSQKILTRRDSKRKFLLTTQKKLNQDDLAYMSKFRGDFIFT